MEIRELTCIGCPVGCFLKVEMNGDEVTSVTGNGCPRGSEYGRKECTNPTRIVTSTVQVENGLEDVVPVKTENDVPKGMMMDCIRTLKNVKIEAPVHIGDIVLENVCNTKVNVIATKNVDMKK